MSFEIQYVDLGGSLVKKEMGGVGLVMKGVHGERMSSMLSPPIPALVSGALLRRSIAAFLITAQRGGVFVPYL